MTKKYKLLEDDMIRTSYGAILYRIESLIEFKTITGKTINIGDLGGYISSENNLSHKNTCWVDYNAEVSDTSIIKGNAFVGGNSLIRYGSIIKDNAIIDGYAKVFHGVVKDNAKVMDSACVYGKVKGSIIVRDFAEIHVGVTIGGSCSIGYNCIITE